jgi:hypothetical protein
MQKLAKHIHEPEGYFLHDIKLTPAGIRRFEDWFYDHIHDEAKYFFRHALQDVVGECSNNCWEPFLVLPKEFSWCNEEFVFYFKPDEYEPIFVSIEAYRLEKIAKILDETHEIFQKELTRLGW